jgi:hypothetical protein
MAGGRGDIRGGCFTREEREILQRALHEGRVTVASTENQDLHLAESLFQRGYFKLDCEADVESEKVFLPSSIVESALKADPQRN